MDATPRLRMFAGPNGSGKSTIKAAVESMIGPELLGVYINADDIEAAIRRDGGLDISSFSVKTTAHEIMEFFRQSSLLTRSSS
jgi:predicted ABC-type ATPase